MWTFDSLSFIQLEIFLRSELDWLPAIFLHFLLMEKIGGTNFLDICDFFILWFENFLIDFNYETFIGVLILQTDLNFGETYLWAQLTNIFCMFHYKWFKWSVCLCLSLSRNRLKLHLFLSQIWSFCKYL